MADVWDRAEDEQVVGKTLGRFAVVSLISFLFLLFLAREAFEGDSGYYGRCEYTVDYT